MKHMQLIAIDMHLYMYIFTGYVGAVWFTVQADVRHTEGLSRLSLAVLQGPDLFRRASKMAQDLGDTAQEYAKTGGAKMGQVLMP